MCFVAYFEDLHNKTGGMGMGWDLQWMPNPTMELSAVWFAYCCRHLALLLLFLLLLSFNIAISNMWPGTEAA